MNKKILFLDSLVFDSDIQVGSHRYANLFRNNNYEVFSLSHYLNIYKFIRGNSEDKELIESWRKGVQMSENGIYFYTPFCFLPYLNLPVLDSLRAARNSFKFCYPNLRTILKNEGFVNIDVAFVNNINLFPALKFVNPKVTVLRISDRIEAFKNVPDTIVLFQNEVAKSSDIIFATSMNLYEETKKINNNTYYLPNGVDEDFIMKESVVHSLPDEYKNIRKPIILYIGAISDWFDYELYEYGIAKLRDISFVAIGPVSGVNYSRNLAKIQQYAKTYENFYYLGSKPHSELKKYLAFSDIGIIPFKVNSLTDEINPVKFFEYAAYGLPVIASHLSELLNYRENVLFYKNREEYVDSITRHSDKKKRLSQKLIDFAHKNTWEKRFEFVLSRIERSKNDGSNHCDK
jgi:glycosyltransferase involved in cell wall biosynthesis